MHLFHSPLPIRATQPSYASFSTSASLSSSGSSCALKHDIKDAAGPKKRFAVAAPALPPALLCVLHRLTGHEAPLACEVNMRPEDGSVVRVLGWRAVQSRSGGSSHLVYTILAASPSSSTPGVSEARLVQRRYRDFAKLHTALAPVARAARVALPALPSKMVAFGRNLSTAIGMQRQRALHEWLSFAVGQPQLQCDALRVFLGLSPLQLPPPPLPPPAYSAAAALADERHASAGCSDDDEASSATDMHVENGAESDSGYASMTTDAGAEHSEGVVISVDLADLERQAIETMLDDELWGRRQ